jgi:hypothetical protein
LYDKNSIGAQKYQEFSNELLGVKKDTIISDIPNAIYNNELKKVIGEEIK